jgi:hypothetical protein
MELKFQLNSANGKVLFVAKTPSVGFAVYDVQPADTCHELDVEGE